MVRRTIHVEDIPNITLENFWSLRNDVSLIDVRAPIEFEKGCLPGALNMGLFDNTERAEIGTLWQHHGHDAALGKGYEFLDRSENTLLASINQLPKDKPLYVYCAKGGLRSRMACNLIRSTGREPIQITGGYRQFRFFCDNSFVSFGTSSAKIIILSGLAGAGKTFIINHLNNALDLEHCAQHSGSAFGHIGEQPATTKNFEANILDSISNLDLSKSIFVEAESRRIGKLSIPNPIWQKMCKADQIVIEAPLEVRVQRMIDRYVFPQNKLLLDELVSATEKLKRFFSNKRYAEVLLLLKQEKYQDYWSILLAEHYDGLYSKAIKTRKTLGSVCAEDPIKAAREIQSAYL